MLILLSGAGIGVLNSNFSQSGDETYRFSRYDSTGFSVLAFRQFNCLRHSQQRQAGDTLRPLFILASRIDTQLFWAVLGKQFSER